MKIQRDEEMLKFHIKYMDKFEAMNDDERKVFVRYMEMLGSPAIVITGEKLDLSHVGKVQHC